MVQRGPGLWWQWDSSAGHRKELVCSWPCCGGPSAASTEGEMSVTVVRQAWTASHPDQEALLSREWLVTNGLGGYASGTIAGVATRRYHGYLIASLPAPFGRTIFLN